MMKQPVNFRLSIQAIHTLSLLKDELHANKTTVVEAALQAYAAQTLAAKNPLLAYAGIIDNTEAKNILRRIKSSRLNKTERVKF